MFVIFMPPITFLGTCGLSVTTFFHQVLNYYYLTVYIMFKPKMSRKAVYTEGAGPVCKCMGQCTLEGSVQG